MKIIKRARLVAILDDASGGEKLFVFSARVRDCTILPIRRVMLFVCESKEALESDINKDKPFTFVRCRFYKREAEQLNGTYKVLYSGELVRFLKI